MIIIKRFPHFRVINTPLGPWHGQWRVVLRPYSPSECICVRGAITVVGQCVFYQANSHGVHNQGRGQDKYSYST